MHYKFISHYNIMDNNMIKKNLWILIVIILVVYIGYHLQNTEYFTAISNESLQNLASMYNLNNLTATNMNVTQKLDIVGDVNVSGKFNLLPTGVIVAWNGSTPPAGWVLCDGQNGAPDLRGRFVMGFESGHSSYGEIGNKGGAETIKLSTNELPAHSHQFKSGDTTGHIKEFKSGHENENKSDYTLGAPRSGSHGDWQYQSELHMTNTGLDGHHENRPPYYILAYIMRT